MCYNSLASGRKTRRAERGETLTLRTLSGEYHVRGFVAPQACDLPVCVADGTKLRILGSAPNLEQRMGVRLPVDVTLEEQTFADILCFPDGKRIHLADIGENITVICEPVMATVEDKINDGPVELKRQLVNA